MGKVLSLIGGGSVRTYYFIESLIRFCRELDIEEVRVMDTDAEKLRYFGGIAAYLARRGESGLKVTLTGDAEMALRGADYVVTTIRVGGDEARTKDELSEGLIGQETTGAGGFSYAIRTIPVMLAYMKLIRRLAKPEAPVFNFTNPAGLVTQALYDAGFEGVIGICDNATGIKTDTAEALGVNASDLLVKVYGLNHLSWASRVELFGTDILPKLMFFFVLAGLFLTVQNGIASVREEKYGAPARQKGAVNRTADSGYDIQQEDHFQRDRRNRIAELDVWLKNGLIDRKEYNELKRRYSKDT